MRQVGILAAAAIYALDNNLPNLWKDHEKAIKITEGNLSIFSLLYIIICYIEVLVLTLKFLVTPMIGKEI